LTTYPI